MSLKQLENMSYQEIFDKVTEHLLEQNAKSMAPEGRCMYHGPDGKKCALGIFMTAEEASNYELLEWSDLIYGKGSPKFPSTDDTADSLLISLQNIHDGFNPEEWEKALEAEAVRYHLKFRGKQTNEYAE